MRKNYFLWTAMLGLFFYETTIIAFLWFGDPPEWFRVHFYSLSWWPFLILVETTAQILRGYSLLYTNPKDFLWLCCFSVPFWTAFEILNTIIKNWIYVGLPEGSMMMPLRWLGYIIAYASVLPVIRVYIDLLGTDRHRPASIEVPALAQKPIFSTVSIAIALALLLLCVRYPQTFYPLAWAFPFFLTEPLVLRENPRKSYLLSWQHGQWLITLKTIGAGLLAGATWEFLNWQAQAKWIYTIPHDVVLFKIFEMPILGYLGFGAFAICAESFSNLMLTNIKTKQRLLWKAGLTLGAAISLLGFAMIDQYTWVK